MAWFGKTKNEKEVTGVGSLDQLFMEVKKIREQLVFLERKVDRLLGNGQGGGGSRGGDRRENGGHFRPRNQRRFRIFKRPAADESAETDRQI